jgi:hypothetical protein
MTKDNVQEPLTELQKDAANLLFALHDAWPYVHGHCTIESKKKAIQALIVKHGEFADLQPPAAQRQWVGLTDEEMLELFERYGHKTSALLVAHEAKLREKNAASSPTIPDALTRADCEGPEYTSGWNDCRAEILKGMK